MLIPVRSNSLSTTNKMDFITIYVKRSGQADSHDLSGTTLVDVFVQNILKKGESLIFENEDFLLKNSGLRIEETNLFNQAELEIVELSLRHTFIPENHLLFFQGKEFKVFLEPIEGINLHKMTESFTLRCESILPFDVIDQSLFRKLSIVKRECDCELKLNKENNHYHKKLVLEKRIEKENPDQIPSDLFVHDESYPGKIYVDELPDLKLVIDELIIQTGSVMAGGYPLSRFIHERTLDVDIFSYTLDFLRLILAKMFAMGKKVEVYLTRFNNLDSYQICPKEENNPFFNINFVHVGLKEPEDLILSPEENRSKVMRFILNDFDFTASITCYDGETIFLNSLTREKKSYFRLTTGFRYLNYSKMKNIELIPIPEVQVAMVYEWREGYRGDIERETKHVISLRDVE